MQTYRPKRRLFGKHLRLVMLLLVTATLQGCYYMQAIGGQLDLMQQRVPIDDVIADPATDDQLRARLQMVLDARQFAVDDLLLPDNDSYRSYADLERDYVLWNVFAAPEFSLEPKQWCYPVVGCVFYRGYFKETKARKFAGGLEDDGLDVIVGGVPAYSTLGKFDDPVLNTMMRWPDFTLVETLFHELAHQRLYVKGDTPFNESFATAVAEVGLHRWVVAQGLSDRLQYIADSRALQDSLRALSRATWDELEALYDSDVSDDEKRIGKARIFEDTEIAAQALIDESGLPRGNWLARPMNNARMVSIGAYQSKVAAFQRLLSLCEDDLECFYRHCDALAEFDYDHRQAELTRLADEQVSSAPLASPAAER